VPSMSARVKEFLAAAGVPQGVFVDVVSFGDSADLEDQLAELVVSGPKRATTSLLRWYDQNGEPMPQVGNLFVVVDGAGEPRCLCRTVSAEVKRFADVDPAFAWDEGEGDRTLGYWRTAHRAFFEREGRRAGFAFTEDMEVVLHRFELVHVPAP